MEKQKSTEDNYKMVCGQKSENSLLTIVLFATVLFLLIIIIFSEISETNIKEENTIYKTILHVETKTIEASQINSDGLEDYDRASESYIKQDYENVKNNCQLARDHFSKSSQAYLNIRAELQLSELEDPLFDNLIEQLKYASEINLNLYEACEYFESASGYYELYFNTDVSYDDQSFDLGGEEIDAMNEKIDLHDENVRKYNELMSQYTILLEKRLDDDKSRM